MRGSAGNLSLLSLASLRERSQWAGPTPTPEKPWPSRALLGEVAGSRRGTCSLVTSFGCPVPPLGVGGMWGGPVGMGPRGGPSGRRGALGLAVALLLLAGLAVALLLELAALV